MNKYDKQHLKDLQSIESRIERIFNKAVKEAARIGARIDEIDPDRIFSFSDYPSTKKEIEKLLHDLSANIEASIVNAVESAWTLANNKNNELCRMVFGDNVGKLSESQYRRYFSNNWDALKAFNERKEKGLNLSDRVWSYTDAFRQEIELGLDVGIRNGMSAQDMARELNSWLKYPDMLFRRVRDEHGQLKLSQRAAAFHPGQGVYRSSYKNARRLAATETNIAYRTSDHERWQQLDFVVGIRIVLSNNHTLLGSDGKPHPFTDICDELSAEYGSTNTSGKGCYPKDFKFTGWHPHCRCHAESILKTDDEMMEDNLRILRGDDPTSYKESSKYVKDVPKEFEEWLSKNEEKAKRSYSMPYFIKDNEKYIPDGYKSMYGMRNPYDTFTEYQQAMAYNKKYAGFSDAIKANNKELSELLPVMQGKIMNFTEADGKHSNPHFSDRNANKKGYLHNCQTCTLSYELRRRGFDVEALPNPIVKGYEEYREFKQFCIQNNTDWKKRWLTYDGKAADYDLSYGLVKDDTVDAKLSFINNKTIETGRYEIYVVWKEKNAHVFTLERQSDGNLLWFDPQSGKKGNAITFKRDIIDMNKDYIGIMRIDDKIINPKFAKRFIRASK